MTSLARSNVIIIMLLIFYKFVTHRVHTIVNWFLESWVKFPCTKKMRIQTLHQHWARTEISCDCGETPTGSWTQHLLTRRRRLKTGLPPTAVTSSKKSNGHRTHPTLVLLNSMSGELSLDATRHVNPSQIPSTSWRKSCKQLGWPARELHQQGHAELCEKTSSLCESWERTLWARLQKTVFAGFWAVGKLWQSEMSNFRVFVWFEYKHYDENCNLHSNRFS